MKGCASAFAHPTILAFDDFGKTNPPRQRHIIYQTDNPRFGGHHIASRAASKNANARQTPGIAPRDRRANARNSSRPYFFPPVASWLPRSLSALYICWKGGCGPVGAGAGAALATRLAFLAAA